MRQVIFDTETTGLDPREHRLVSVAGLEMVDGFLTGHFIHYHLNPGRPCDPGAAAIHGLTDEYLAKQPTFEVIWPELDSFIRNDRLVIHNARFDLGMLSAELVRRQKPTERWDPVRVIPQYTCTFQKAEAMRGRAKGRNTLDTLAREWGIENLRESTGKHGALIDCLVLFGVFRHLAGLPRAPLVQWQLDHFLNKGFGVHGSFTVPSEGRPTIPPSAEPDTTGVPADVCAVG